MPFHIYFIYRCRNTQGLDLQLGRLKYQWQRLQPLDNPAIVGRVRGVDPFDLFPRESFPESLSRV